MPRLGSDLGSAGSSISNIIPSGWSLGLAFLFILPFIGALIRPFTQLGAASLNAISAIASALIFCASSWIVSLLAYITLLGRAIRPGPRALPVIRTVFIIATVAVLFATLSLYAFNRPRRDLASCIVHGEIKNSCLSELKAEGF